MGNGLVGASNHITNMYSSIDRRLKRGREKKRNLSRDLPRGRSNPKPILEDLPRQPLLFLEDFNKNKISKLSNHVEDNMVKGEAEKQF